MKKFIRMIALALQVSMIFGILCSCGQGDDGDGTTELGAPGKDDGTTRPDDGTTTGEGTTGVVPPEDEPWPNEGTKNVYVYEDGEKQVRMELFSPRMVRVQYSMDGSDGYRPYDPEYYMVQLSSSDKVIKHSYEETEDGAMLTTIAMKLIIQKAPFRVAMYDLEGNLLSGDSDTGVYRNGTQVGIRKTEGTKNAGGIFGFGSGDHGRRDNLNRYEQDFTEFSMSHGRVIAPFFMSSVGYGIFLNTISENTTFFKHGGGFETEGYLDYFFMYGPDFKTVLNEYADITGRMELYGKWALGFMLSKYGNDNATQAEFLEWINRLRDEGYPCDCYVFDYGWRGDVNVTQANHSAGQKWGNQMWSNDKNKFPDIKAMFEEARRLGFHVGLHNNAGTPEASGGKNLHEAKYAEKWVQSYMDSVITTGYGDWFWPDEFDVLGSNTAPVFSAKGAYEAWKEFTDATRPMFMTRGSYAGQHFATAWSGDTDASESDLAYQIGFAIDTGLVGYWATSCDLGGFKTRPSNELYTRWTAEFGAWSALMRTHGHDGREPWDYNTVAQETLKENLKIRYSLYPYLYTSAWQGYSAGVPIMRAMLLEDGSETNPDAWNLNRQYYLGDWFLVAPATEARDTTVSVWFPPNTTWYNYYTGERYEGGAEGKTVYLKVALDEIPVFVKAGAIIPVGPDVNYADEHPLEELTLDIYPKGTTTYTFFEDDGVSRKYITENAYSTTDYLCAAEGTGIRFTVGARADHNPAVYKPVDRSYVLRFNHVSAASGVTLNGTALKKCSSASALEAAESGWYQDGVTLLVKFPDTAKKAELALSGVTYKLPAESQGDGEAAVGNAFPVTDGTLVELELADRIPASGIALYVDTEWKGYSGEGFVKPFKANGDKLVLRVNVDKAGEYDLSIRVNCGKKNDNTDRANRTGGLYVGNTKVGDLSFTITDTWGDANKNGVWKTYTVENVKLSKGLNTITIKAEGNNPGNYNLDWIRFDLVDNSLNGFSEIAANKADRTNGVTFSGAVAKINAGGAYLGFSEVLADNKKELSVRLSSTTGGTLTVYETGVGDKILAVIELPKDGVMKTVRVSCKDTDLDPSAIYLSFTANNGSALSAQVEWFKFH